MSDLSADTKVPVTHRAATDADRDFLFALYSSTRSDELAGLGWGQVQQEAFLMMQFEARRRCHALDFASADDRIILRDGRPIGRIMIARTDDEVRLVDIALLPGSRSQGIGTSLIRELTAEAEETGKPIRLHVDTASRAVGLYRRLGFTAIGENGIHECMEWRPATCLGN